MSVLNKVLWPLLSHKGLFLLGENGFSFKRGRKSGISAWAPQKANLVSDFIKEYNSRKQNEGQGE